MDLSNSITFDADCPSCGIKVSDTVQTVSRVKQLRCNSCQQIMPVEEGVIRGIKQNLDNLEMSIIRKRGAKMLRPLKRFFTGP